MNLPQTIRGYQLHEPIGKGGFGAVYRAYQSIGDTSREVAIKVIMPHIANDPAYIRRFQTEVESISRLAHPFIVPLIDAWRDPSGAYLVMRMLNGGDLKTLLKAGPLERHSTAQILDQVCAALTTAHRNGVIHRDLKPSNILLDEDGNAYLADFGIAKSFLSTPDELTNPDMIVGTLDYIAPEQARRDPVTNRTDIYSLGVVLYEMLVGEHPFATVSSVERMYKHLNEPLPDLVLADVEDTIVQAINDIVQKATQKDPAHRYGDVLEVAAEFRQAAALDDSQEAVNIVEQLTRREQDILRLIIDDHSNKEIANQLFLALPTVKWYISRIYKKLSVNNRVQAIVRARDLHLIVSDSDNGADSAVSMTFIPSDEFEADNPYKGLQAFQAADHRDFFGREDLIAKLVKRFGEKSDLNRFLAVVGPSGSGKSSLVKAGLVPAIWRGDLAGSESWYVVEMLPGTHPFDELEVALMKVAANQSDNLHEQLTRDPRGLIRTAQLILPDDDSQLLLIIDQFEEVFTFVEDDDRRIAFLEMIHESVTDKRSRVRVVVTLRADFFDRPLQYPQFGELIRHRTETVLPLSADELERAIVKPAHRVGARFEEGLVAQISREVAYQPGALPLLQYALTELFERREGRLLTQAAYQKIGGAVGALAKRADDLYHELDDKGQEAVRQMFLRLVTLGEGAEDTRRRVDRSELLAITDDVDLMEDIISVYADYRLLSLDHDPASRAPTVEVAHEAILREWERLRTWLNDSRDDIKLQRQLATLATAWNANNNDDSYLVRGTRLETFQLWSLSTELSLTPREMDYLSASIEAHERREAEKIAQIEREKRLEQRARTVLRGLVGVFLTAAVIAIGLALFAFGERSTAQEQRKQAETERDHAETAEQEARRQASIGLAALAEKELEGTNPERGVLLALEALENYPYTPQAMEALARSVEGYRALRLFDGSHSSANRLFVGKWSPDGRRIAVAGWAAPNTVIIWDAESGQELLTVGKHTQTCGDTQFVLVPHLAWSPDGTRLVTAAGAAVNTQTDCLTTGLVWDAETGQTLLTLSGNDSHITAVNWHETAIITGHADGSLTMWNADTGTEQRRLTGHGGWIRDIEWSADGNRIATASTDGTIRIWNAESGEEEQTLTVAVGSAFSVAWSPDSGRLVSGGSDSLVYIWDALSGDIVQTLSGHTNYIQDVGWSPDGGRILSHSWRDRTIKIWDAATGSFVFQLRNFSARFAEFSPNSMEVLTNDFNKHGFAYIWQLPDTIPLLPGHHGGQLYSEWSPDGTMVASGGAGGTYHIFDAETHEKLWTFSGIEGWGQWSPDSTRVAMPSGVESFGIFDARSGERLFDLFMPNVYGLSIGWSTDGQFAAGAGWEPGDAYNAQIWNVETGEQVLMLHMDEPNCMPWWPTWSPDMSNIMTGCMQHEQPGVDRPAVIWDSQSGERIALLESEYGWTFRTSWSPDGTRILTSYELDVVRIWDAETHEVLLTYGGHLDQVWAASWSPDGTRIASGDLTGLVKIWDAETGEEYRSFAVPGSVFNVSWSPDGREIIVAVDGISDPIIRRVWEPDDLIEYAYECCVTRDLTPEERAQFGLPPNDD